MEIWLLYLRKFQIILSHSGNLIRSKWIFFNFYENWKWHIFSKASRLKVFSIPLVDLVLSIFRWRVCFTETKRNTYFTLIYETLIKYVYIHKNYQNRLSPADYSVVNLLIYYETHLYILQCFINIYTNVVTYSSLFFRPVVI